MLTVYVDTDLTTARDCLLRFVENREHIAWSWDLNGTRMIVDDERGILWYSHWTADQKFEMQFRYFGSNHRGEATNNQILYLLVHPLKPNRVQIGLSWEPEGAADAQALWGEMEGWWPEIRPTADLVGALLQDTSTDRPGSVTARKESELSNSPDQPRRSAPSQAADYWDVYFREYERRKAVNPSYTLKAYCDETGAKYSTARNAHAAYRKRMKREQVTD